MKIYKQAFSYIEEKHIYETKRQNNIYMVYKMHVLTLKVTLSVE
jgi:hypothetical protein